MAYIDSNYYCNVFRGYPVKDNDPYSYSDDFERLADIASDVVYAICVIKPNEEDLVSATFKKAVAYQVELLYRQGGVDAIVGMPEGANRVSSESLGDYSVSYSESRQGQTMTTYNGIPVSPMSIMLLRQMGLMNRWAFAKR